MSSELRNEPAIVFSTVNKTFLIGTFSDVLNHMFHRPVKCARVHALADISFNVAPGELLGVLGRNGAGKSTLLRVAAGVYAPDDGFVSLSQSPLAIFEMGLGANGHMTGREFCRAYFTLRDVPRRAQEKTIDDVAEFSELGDYFDMPIYSYSSGMTARLYFSVVTAQSAGIILLDEILSVGDEHFKGKCLQRILGIIDNGCSGILVSHDWFSTIRMCNRIMILEKGRVEYLGPSVEAARRFLHSIIHVSKRVFFSKKEELIGQVLSYRSGSLFSFTFEVEATCDLPVTIGFAVEIPKLSLIVLLQNDYTVTMQKGTHSITLHIPAFPMSCRECFLSLFLSKPRKPGQASTEEGYDLVSWTSGESVTMKNAQTCKQLPEPVVHVPLKWRRVE